eukprot:scaffold310_cov335-Pavlova_lutheri.AAC.80
MFTGKARFTRSGVFGFRNGCWAKDDAFNNLSQVSTQSITTEVTYGIATGSPAPFQCIHVILASLSWFAPLPLARGVAYFVKTS